MAPARLCILYGSQTGTAEEVAWDLQRQLELERSYRVTCQSMDSFDVTTLPRETFAIFITATTGQVGQNEQSNGERNGERETSLLLFFFCVGGY